MVHAIGDNHDHSTNVSGPFTPAGATEMLPLLRMIVRDVVTLSRSIEAQKDQLRGMDQVDESGQPEYADELSDVRGSLAADELRLQSCLRELTALGVEPHVPIDGSIDFPAEWNRRAIRLCWHPDDDTVSHWHEIGQPQSQRRRWEPGR